MPRNTFSPEQIIANLKSPAWRPDSNKRVSGEPYIGCLVDAVNAKYGFIQ
jgi:hypothetical protein